MSEFIAACPKCRQQILCDTAYIGRRIACPLCLQEITMPDSPGRRGPAQTSPTPPEPSNLAKGKRNSLVVPVVAGLFSVIVVVAVVVLVLRKPAVVAVLVSPATPPVATAAGAQVAPAIPNPAPATSPTPVPTPAMSAVPANRAPGNQGGCRAIWTMDQAGGTQVPDITGNGYNGEVRGSAVKWLKSVSPDGRGLKLTGHACVEIPGPVVNTAESFTVSANVNLAPIVRSGYQTVVSIDGKVNPGFVLQFCPNDKTNDVHAAMSGQFGFACYGGDHTAVHTVKVLAGESVMTNTWYQLVGVYDAEVHTLSLYLDGKLKRVRPYTEAWPATGNTAIGRGEYLGHGTHYLDGIVRDVRMYPTALTAEQIKELAR